jgi:hypothetical protein
MALTVKIDGDVDERVSKMPEVLETVQEAAHKVAEIAKGSAPVLSGDYAASITVQKTKSGWRVFAADYKSAWIEFGVPSHGEPARYILRNAATRAGLKFTKQGG